MTSAAPTLDVKQLKIVSIPSDTALTSFYSGEDEIDRNLYKCGEWHTCHRSRTYCAYLSDDLNPYGFYCLGQHAHDLRYAAGLFERASDDARSFVPFIYLNYLAVRQGWRRQKIGTMLLLNAIERCSVVIKQIGAYGVALNALTSDAAALYDRYGFKARDASRAKYPLMVLPARSVLDLFP